jgi:hypothetical protein
MGHTLRAVAGFPDRHCPPLRRRSLGGTARALDTIASDRYTPTDSYLAGPTMPTQRDATTQAVLLRLLEEYHLTGDTRLYRETERASLAATATPGVYRLAASAHPRETLVDVYGPGYLVQAEEVGAGLAFAESASPGWQETKELRALQAGLNRAATEADHVEVEVRLGDLLERGGVMYPVQSVAVQRAWYFTLPSGSVEVREAT